MSKKKTKSVPIVTDETEEPEPEPVEVEVAPVTVTVSDAPPSTPQPTKPEAAVPSIVDLAKNLDDSKVEMAEKLGIPIRGLLRWAATIENITLANAQGMKQLGVDLAPLVTAIKRNEANPTNAPSVMGPAQQSAANPLTGLLQFLPQLLPMVTGGGGSALGDQAMRYFLELGFQNANLGNFMFREMLKKSLPEAMAKFEVDHPMPVLAPPSTK